MVQKKGNEDASSEEQSNVAVGFRAVHVFDQVDTDGKPLAEGTAEGDPSEYTDKLKRFIAQRGIELRCRQPGMLPEMAKSTFLAHKSLPLTIWLDTDSFFRFAFPWVLLRENSHALHTRGLCFSVFSHKTAAHLASRRHPLPDAPGKKGTEKEISKMGLNWIQIIGFIGKTQSDASRVARKHDLRCSQRARPNFQNG